MKKILFILILSILLCGHAMAITWSNGGDGGGSGTLLVYTVGTLPAAPADGTSYTVTDGADAADCTVGSGTSLNICIYDAGGAAYVIAGDGAGSGNAFTTHDTPQGTDPVASGAGTLTWAEGEALDITGDSGTDTITLAAEDATSANKGVATFNTDNFTVTAGDVVIKDGGVAPAELATDDFGDFSVSGGSATLDNDVVGPDEMADGDHDHVVWTTGAASVKDFALDAAADAGDQDISSVNKLEGVDAAIYIDLGADTLAEIVADGRVDITTAEARFEVDALAYLSIVTADGGATTISQTSDGTDQITIGDGSDRVDISTDTWDVTNGVISASAGMNLTAADGQLLDLSGITHTAATDEGLVLPTWADVSPTTDQPYLAYDTAANAIKVYDGGWLSFATEAAPLDAKYIVQQADATLTGEQALGALASGILYSTTTTGVITIATEAQLETTLGIAFGTSKAVTDDYILVADGTDFESVEMTGDVTINNGVTTIGADTVALTTDTTGNYTATIADAGNTTITVVNGTAEGGAVTLDAVDLNCTDCINATEIEDIYLLIAGDSMGGSLTMPDDTTLIFGTGSDWTVEYDENGDDAIEFVTAATGAATTSDPMFLIQVGASPVADQDVFAVYKGTTRLFDIDEDGDVVIAGTLTLPAVDSPMMTFDTTDADDTDYHVGTNADQGASSDDAWEIRTNSTPGSNVLVKVEPAGDTEPGLHLTHDLYVDGGDIVMDVNTDTAILIADGTDFDVVVPSGDVAITNAGVTTVVNTSITSQTAYDIYYVDGSGDMERLPQGTEGHFLRQTATAPEWAAVSATADTTGGEGAVQYNSGGNFDSETAFVYTAGTNTLLAGDILTVGTTDPADAGTIRLENAASIVFEDTEGTGEVTALTVDATEAIIIGDTDTLTTAIYAEDENIVITDGGTNIIDIATSTDVSTLNTEAMNFRVTSTSPGISFDDSQDSGANTPEAAWSLDCTTTDDCTLTLNIDSGSDAATNFWQLATADTGVTTWTVGDISAGHTMSLEEDGDVTFAGDTDLHLEETKIELSDDGEIELDATADGMDDDEYNGITIGGRNCGETLVQWDVVELANDTDPWHKADATVGSGEFPAFGIAVAACTDTNEAIILVRGVVRNEGWTGMTTGTPIYLGETDGAIITNGTPPSTSGDAIQIIGWALSDSEIYFDFSRPYSEVQ